MRSVCTGGFFWKELSIKNISNSLLQYIVKFNQNRQNLCPGKLGTVCGKMSKGMDFNAMNTKLHSLQCPN